MFLAFRNLGRTCFCKSSSLGC